MRRLRLYDPKYYCEVTIRGIDGTFAFDPNDIDIREQIYGLLAEAVRQTGVAIFVFHFMSNHYHGLYGYTSPAQLVKFLAYLHAGLSRLANETLGRSGAFWCSSKVLAVATDAKSVGYRFNYIMGQAVRAGICNHPSEFPGASAVDALLYGVRLMGRKVDRSRRCRDELRLAGGAKDDSAYETRVEVPLTTPACWAGLSAEELRRLYQGIADEIAANPAAYPPGCKAEPDSQEPPPRRGQVEQGQEGQVPGTCLSHETTAEVQVSLTPEPEPPPPLKLELEPEPPATASAVPVGPPKVEVPNRQAEDGGPHRQGKVKPKRYEGTKMSGKLPMLLSADRQEVAEYETRYKLAVQAYREAKRVWRAKSQRREGALRAAKINLPAWMLLGTLPLIVRDE